MPWDSSRALRTLPVTQMMHVLRISVVAAGFVALLSCVPAYAQTPQQQALGAIGFHRERSYFSPEPWEHYDTVTGNVMLTFTDLVLPGNAGRQLAFQRTYNNNVPTGTSPASRWSFGIAGVPMQVIEQNVPDDFPISTGDVNLLMSSTPKLVMADGSRHQTLYIARPASVVAARIADVISPGFIKYNRSAHQLRLPDGTICNYDESSGRLVSIVDRFLNVISLTWGSTSLVVTQDLQNSQVRTITLILDAASRVTGMQFEGNTWQYEYDHDINGTLDITTVTLPNLSEWTFTYDQKDLRDVTTAFGGRVEYEYVDYEIHPDPSDPSYSVDQHTLRFRRSGGRDVTPGEWQVFWDTQGLQYAWATHIYTPSGRDVVYTHGIQVSDQTHAIGGNYGVVDRQIWSGSWSPSGSWVTGQKFEQEHSTYQVVKVVEFSPSEWWGTVEPSTRTLTRDGRDYTTQFGFNASNFGDYHNPNEIIETGHLTRTTVRHYTHNVSTWILGLPTSEEVTVGSETFRREWTWATTSGFKTSETSWYLFGSTGARLTTAFLPDGRGNTYRVTPPSSLPTYFGYDWARVSLVQTPEHTTSRNINLDGTVQSETITGRTTTFQYDPLFRPTVTQPPGGTNPIVTTYNDATGTIRRQRGTSDVSTLVDGFGRVIATTDSTGVNNTTEYDAEGRVRRIGYPFRVGDPYIVTTLSYDALDRVTTRLNPDSTSSQNIYGDGTMTTIDENGRQTARTFQAFGHPDDGRRASLIDADTKTWTYQHNALGQLKRVTAPDGIVRTWQYNVNAQLEQETHPESGVTTYVYDTGGRLAQKTDAKQMAFVYTYDGNNRVRTVTAGAVVTTFTYEPGTDNRASASVGPTSSTFTYDAAGRPSSRTDTVDGSRFLTTYGYDANDNLTSIWYPSFGTAGDRRRVGYEYDSEHRISRVFDLQVTRDFAKEFVYHASGALLSYKAGNNLQSVFTYDASRYWLSSLNIGGLWSLQYLNYDGVGNVRTLNDSRPGMNQTLAYDGLDRLLAVSSSGYPSVSYTYDAHGNRTSASGVTHTYYPGILRLQSQGSETYTYDDNGNLLTSPNRSYTYTPRNMQATATVFGATTTYGYDADDWRIKKTTGGITTYYLRGLDGQLLTEWKNPGGPSGETKDYIYAGARLVSTIGRPWTESSDFFGTIVPDGPPVTVMLSAGQNAWLDVAAAQGQRVSLFGSDGTIAYQEFGCDVWQSLHRPGGGAVAGSSTCMEVYGYMDVQPLSDPGTYRVSVDPSGNASGSLTLRMYEVPPDFTGTITPDGPAVSVTILKPGQNAGLTFTGAAGQRVSLLGNPSITGHIVAGCDVWAGVFKPDGVQLPNTSTCMEGGAYVPFIEPVTLPVAGSYMIAVDPQTMATGSMALTLYNVPADVSGMLTSGSPFIVPITKPGQNATLTFAGTAGQRIALQASAGISGHLSWGCDVGLGIVRPDTGAWLAGTPLCIEGGGFLETTTLPATGIYTVVIDPATVATGSTTITLYDVPADWTGSLTINGTAVSVSLASAQQGLLTFGGTAGQSIRVRMTGNTTGGMWVILLNPNNQQVTWTFSGAASFDLGPTTLSMTGTYTVVLDPQNANAGSVSVQVTSP